MLRTDIRSPRDLLPLPTVSRYPLPEGCTYLPVPNLDLQVLAPPGPIPARAATILPEHSSSKRLNITDVISDFL